MDRPEKQPLGGHEVVRDTVLEDVILTHYRNVGRLDEKLISALPWRFRRRMANGGGIAGPLTAAVSRYRMRNRPVVVRTPGNIKR